MSFCCFVQELIFGATFGQPTTDPCYVKATFVVPQNTPETGASDDVTVQFTHHISSRGTRYSSLYEVDGVVCRLLLLNFCSYSYRHVALVYNCWSKIILHTFHWNFVLICKVILCQFRVIMFLCIAVFTQSE